MGDVLKILGILLLLAIGLLALAATACGSLFVFSSNTHEGAGYLVLGTAAVVLCIWGIVALVKSMRNNRRDETQP